MAKSTETEFWLSVFAGAEAAATEYNIRLDITGPETEEDYEAQNRMIAEAVSAGADALVFSAIDYENNASAIDAAAEAGVKVVAIDSSVASGMVSTYIGTDNHAAGRMAAQAALDGVEGQLTVGLVNYDISSANGQERELGARELLGESGRAEVVAVINTLAEAGQAQKDAEAMLREHPEINVLIAFNEPTSVGAAYAVDSLDLSESVFLVGFDSNVATVDGLRTAAWTRSSSKTPTPWATSAWRAPINCYRTGEKNWKRSWIPLPRSWIERICLPWTAKRLCLHLSSDKIERIAQLVGGVF